MLYTALVPATGIHSIIPALSAILITTARSCRSQDLSQA